MSASDVGDRAEQLGRRAEQSDTLDHFARSGLVAYGLVHVVLGWLSVQLALGHHTGTTTTTGALQDMARQPFGRVPVWAVAVGLLLLVVWRAVEAAFGHRDEDGSDRVKQRVVSGLKGLLYAALAVSAFKVASGAGSSSKGKGATATVMGWPGGQWLVALVGLGIIGYGGYMAWRGWKEKFAEHLDTAGRMGRSGAAYLVLGKIGYIGKGASLAIVGGLFVFAGIDHSARETRGGLDQALEKVLQEPYGQVLIVLIGVGLVCYGLFCFARARHLDR